MQKKEFNTFWNLGDFHKQNIHLESRMKSYVPATRRTNSVQAKKCTWIYKVRSGQPKCERVCKRFFLKLYMITNGRLQRVQEKLLEGRELNDGRGKHATRLIKLTKDAKDLIMTFCKSLPHKRSHYSRRDSDLFYFENSDLNLRVLYSLFDDYFQSVTGEELSLSRSSFCDYFNHTVPFTFRPPRSDVCDFCFEQQIQGGEDSVEYKLHLREAEKHKELKQSLIDDNTALVLEFDYSQNLPLPKLPVADQFYCRLLWLYLCNVHVHGIGASYMFFYMEGVAKKGANSVCAFLKHAIDRCFDKQRHKKIVLLSDACGGQNRNYTVFSFCAILAASVHVPVIQVFPVRGHSFSTCDRNFGTYAKVLKRMEVVESPEDYVSAIQMSREPPFTMVDAEKKAIIIDFETILKKNVRRDRKMKISEACVIEYRQGYAKLHRNYSLMSASSHSVYCRTTLNELFADVRSLPLSPRIGVSSAKAKDVRKLLRYVSAGKRSALEEYLQHINGVADNENGFDVDD